LGVSLKRFNFSYLLWLLLSVFGALYVIEVVYGGLWAKDLWANLFAAFLAVVLIDRIVEKSKLQRSERSIRYVRRKIAGVCTDLIWRMGPPKGWQELLAKVDSNWDDFYRRVWTLRTDALSRMEALLDKHHYLMDAELRNYVFDMVESLNDDRWIIADLDIVRERDVGDLSSIAKEITIIIHQSIEAIKRHKLLEYSYRSVTWSKGEQPKIERRTVPDPQALRKAQYSYYENLLKESIKFRDECSKQYLMKLKEK
jgi:hypothetical protein